MASNKKLRPPSEERSRIMSAIRSRGNKSTEAKVRALLVRMGVKGWKVCPRGVEGRPDFAFPAFKAAIFVDGCFWHGCPSCSRKPRTNRAYWLPKIMNNRKRDLAISSGLRRSGWVVVRFWEHDIGLPGFSVKLKSAVAIARKRKVDGT